MGTRRRLSGWKARPTSLTCRKPAFHRSRACRSRDCSPACSRPAVELAGLDRCEAVPPTELSLRVSRCHIPPRVALEHLNPIRAIRVSNCRTPTRLQRTGRPKSTSSHSPAVFPRPHSSGYCRRRRRPAPAAYASLQWLDARAILPSAKLTSRGAATGAGRSCRTRRSSSPYRAPPCHSDARSRQPHPVRSHRGSP